MPGHTLVLQGHRTNTKKKQAESKALWEYQSLVWLLHNSLRKNMLKENQWIQTDINLHLSTTILLEIATSQSTSYHFAHALDKSRVKARG